MSETTNHGPRCYGYTQDGDLIDHEATIIRGVAMSVLDDHLSLRGVVEELNANGITTVTGKPWQLTSLVRLLSNPRLAGLTPKNRRTTTPAPAILTVAQHEELAAQAAARRGIAPRQRAHNRPVRLLSGLVVCAKDNQPMTGHVNSHGASYRCPSGHAQVQADLVEGHVTDHTLALLDRGARTGELETVATLEAKLEALSRHRAQLTEAKQAGLISEVEARTANGRIKKRRTALHQQIAHLRQAGEPEMPPPGQARQWWESATAAQRRAVLGAVWDRVEIHDPTRRGAAGLDASRVHLVRHHESRKAS